MMGTILVVCTGNICRSPVGAAALSSLLPDHVSVSSAGTHAAVGRLATPETSEFVSRELGADLNHIGQQLTKKEAESADLIITMTAEHRAWVARNAPRVVRRTFTLCELRQIVRQFPEDKRHGSLREIALTASTLRSRVGRANPELDISDPYGGTPKAYEDAFQKILASTRRIASDIRVTQ